MTQETSSRGCGTGLIEPVGTGDYIVSQGDCISSIAAQRGHFWKTVWSDPGNAELRKTRKDPNVLLPGDRLTVPPIRQRLQNCAADQRHRFVRRGEPAKLRLQFKHFGQPRAGAPFRLYVDGRSAREGRLDSEGCLEAGIPGLAGSAQVVVGDGDEQEIYELTLGAIDPVEDIRGARERLANLGYLCPLGDHEIDEATSSALAIFQKDHDLAVTGTLGAATQQVLADTYTA
jgi:N-acetylmuramoyl-L-alanine amidase